MVFWFNFFFSISILGGIVQRKSGGLQSRKCGFNSYYPRLGSLLASGYKMGFSILNLFVILISVLAVELLMTTWVMTLLSISFMMILCSIGALFYVEAGFVPILILSVYIPSYLFLGALVFQFGPY